MVVFQTSASVYDFVIWGYDIWVYSMVYMGYGIFTPSVQSGSNWSLVIYETPG